MFEIDENTRFQLRLLGKGSMILVSIALILALIGYFVRNDRNAADSGHTSRQTDFEASKLYQSKDKLNGELMNRKIKVKGTADSISGHENKTVIWFEQKDNESILKCTFSKENLSLSGAITRRSLTVEGFSRGTLGHVILMDKCSIKQ